MVFCSGGHDVAVDLERDDDAGRFRGSGELADVRQEGALALLLRRVAAHRRVDDRESVVGRPANGLQPVLESLSCRQVGMAAQGNGVETVVGELRPHHVGRR